jgi:hypothetical protein
MPSGPLQKVIWIENAPFMSLKRVILLIFLFSNPKYARQDFLSPIFARLKKRLGTTALDEGLQR